MKSGPSAPRRIISGWIAWPVRDGCWVILLPTTLGQSMAEKISQIGSIDVEEIESWVAEYCREHSLETIADAMAALIQALESDAF